MSVMPTLDTLFPVNAYCNITGFTGLAHFLEGSAPSVTFFGSLTLCSTLFIPIVGTLLWLRLHDFVH